MWMCAIDGHWFVTLWMIARGSLERLQAARFTEVSEECWSRETTERPAGRSILSACKGCLWKPAVAPESPRALSSGTRCVGKINTSLSGRSLSADWAAIGISDARSKVSERCQMQWDRQRERETDYQIRSLLTSLSLSSPLGLGVSWVCSCIMTHKQPFSVNAGAAEATSPYITVCLRSYLWV